MDEILEGLNREQTEAVLHDKGPLLILAGAGSGKTRVLTHRIAYLIGRRGVAPWNILALTFTNKAAKEMRERVDRIVGDAAGEIWVSTFHSACARILRRHIDAIGYDRSFTIYDAEDQKSLMREVCKYLSIDTKNIKERAILSSISKAKDSLITPEEYLARAQGDLKLEKYASAYAEYQKRLKANNALDFDDLICKTIEMLEKCPDILKSYQQRFLYILVDEYQDTNTAQFRLIRLLTPTEGWDGEERNLCVVGDDDQSIYKFRGANIYNILNFQREYPDAKAIKLEQNYRSTKSILNAANEVIKNNRERKEKTLWTANEQGEPVFFTRYDTEYAEADGIVEDISKKAAALSGDYGQFAILYRTNAQSRILEERLIRKSIPYKVVGSVNFYARKEVKDLLAYLKTVDNGMDDLSVRRIINVPKRGIGLSTIDRVSHYALERGISFYQALSQAAQIPDISRSLPKIEGFVALIERLRASLAKEGHALGGLIREILDATGYRKELEDLGPTEAQARLENIEELVNKAAAYEEQEGDDATLGGFLEDIALVADIDSLEESAKAVVLMTLHSSKGLEFPYVYLCGMENNLFPSYLSLSAESPSELEEERRLCYVGITRAKKELHLSAAAQRMVHGETHINQPSLFLSEIPRYLIRETVPFPERRPVFGEGAFLGSGRATGETSPKGISPNGNSPKGSSSRSGGDLFADNPFIQKGFGAAGSKKRPVPPERSKPRKVTPSAASAESLSLAHYQTGDRVRHARFGEGTIRELQDLGGDLQLTVEFDGSETKKMRASYAKLEKLSPAGEG